MNLDDYLRESLRGRPSPRYPEPASNLLRMDSNTNLYGPNPAVARAAERFTDASQYPSPFSDELRDALAAAHGLTRDRILVGNGSDEILDFITKTFLRPGARVCVMTPSFVMYEFYGRVNLGEVRAIPLRDGFQPDVDAIAEAKPALTLLATPNNPTGNSIREDLVDAIIGRVPGVIVLDEAYVEYAEQDHLARASDRVIVTRTFSKAYGLAGLRIGWATGAPETIERLHRAKPPFTVGLFAEAAAIEALRDPAYVEASVAMVRTERPRLWKALAEFAKPYPSDANFVLVDVRRPSGEVAQAVRARGILIRAMEDFPGLETCIRFTIGPREMNDRLLEALRSCCR